MYILLVVSVESIFRLVMKVLDCLLIIMVGLVVNGLVFIVVIKMVLEVELMVGILLNGWVWKVV